VDLCPLERNIYVQFEWKYDLSENSFLKELQQCIEQGNNNYSLVLYENRFRDVK